MSRGRILVVDDEPEMREILRRELEASGFEAVTVPGAPEALSTLPEAGFEVVLTDLRLKGSDGLELARRVAAADPHLPVVVVTAFGSVENAVAAMRAGVYDLVTKPVDLDALRIALDRAVRHHRLSVEVHRLRRMVDLSTGMGEILGESPAVRRLRQTVARVAESDAAVLITGETGTGKELVARAIHRASRRKEGPFIPVNCSAIPEPLIESELFGHVRGAFTDARETRTGLFEQADGGTLFLDEIGELPLSVQPKLLRVLQDRRVRPLGGSERPVDLRLVAATNRDLETAVEEKTFREDLWYRVNVVAVEVPPLRERGRDALLLALAFLKLHSGRTGKPVVGLRREVAERILAYPWPGNVRELQNAIERAVALTTHDELVLEDLPERVREERPDSLVVPTGQPDEMVTVEELERRYILRVLDAVSGNKRRAAKILGLDRKTLYRKLERFRKDVA